MAIHNTHTHTHTHTVKMRQFQERNIYQSGISKLLSAAVNLKSDIFQPLSIVTI